MMEISPCGEGFQGKLITIKHIIVMTKKLYENAQEVYSAPAFAVLPFFSEAAICDVSIDGDGDIDSGVGVDWGELDD